MRILVIDAFTNRAFTGNPAAVCLLEGDGWPAETWMRLVAREMNLSETAFAHPLADRQEADWALRWFTPIVEDDLCGHATLAAAHVLFTEGRASSTVRFATRSGVLSAHDVGGNQITLDFPAASVSECPVTDALVAALGVRPDAAFSTGELHDIVALFVGESAVRRMTPDLGALANFTRSHRIRAVTITAGADAAALGYDFVSRFFSPADGIPEDPVTGSAHTALAPLWSNRLGRERLVGHQVSARGGVIEMQLVRDRVRLTGQAVTVLDGRLVAVPGACS